MGTHFGGLIFFQSIWPHVISFWTHGIWLIKGEMRPTEIFGRIEKNPECYPWLLLTNWREGEREGVREREGEWRGGQTQTDREKLGETLRQGASLRKDAWTRSITNQYLLEADIDPATPPPPSQPRICRPWLYPRSTPDHKVRVCRHKSCW